MHKTHIFDQKNNAKKMFLPTYLPYFFSDRYRKQTIYFFRPNLTEIINRLLESIYTHCEEPVNHKDDAPLQTYSLCKQQTGKNIYTARQKGCSAHSKPSRNEKHFMRINLNSIYDAKLSRNEEDFMRMNLNGIFDAKAQDFVRRFVC